jgi:hypothetical protein
VLSKDVVILSKLAYIDNYSEYCILLANRRGILGAFRASFSARLKSQSQSAVAAL